MADTITSVTNLDIQLLNADRTAAYTVKLDNPKDNVTREQVSTAFQSALTNGWFLANDGSPAMYLGDITINQSIKTKLDGEDFYVTPAKIGGDGGMPVNIPTDTKILETTITVTGATIQGYNYIKSQTFPNFAPKITIAENGLSANVKFDVNDNSLPPNSTTNGTIILIIMGKSIQIPIYVKRPQA